MSTQYDYDLVVIGAGSGGVRAGRHETAAAAVRLAGGLAHPANSPPWTSRVHPRAAARRPSHTSPLKMSSSDQGPAAATQPPPAADVDSRTTAPEASVISTCSRAAGSPYS